MCPILYRDSNVAIIDIAGILKAKKLVTAVKVDVSDLMSGFYVMSFCYHEKKYIGKFVIF